MDRELKFPAQNRFGSYPGGSIIITLCISMGYKIFCPLFVLL
jgi:hypothetical protein